MAPQLVWIGLGNMGRVLACPFQESLSLTDNGVGHVQKPS